MRQELAWQCPEVALVKSAKLQDDLPPLLWGGLPEAKIENTIASWSKRSDLASNPQTRWAPSNTAKLKRKYSERVTFAMSIYTQTFLRLPIKPFK
jgi:hypothetical protein